MSDASAVVVTYDALPWIERSLESVRGHETVVVDHASTDGTVAFVRERFPEVAVVEEENRGLAFGWNTGVARTSGRYVLLLNADAWMHDGALDTLVAFADAHPRAAVVAPRLSNPDGTLQRSVRGYPTLWRIATEYLFLRKLAPRLPVVILTACLPDAGRTAALRAGRPDAILVKPVPAERLLATVAALATSDRASDDRGY